MHSQHEHDFEPENESIQAQNHWLVALVCTIIGVLLTGVVSWMTFGPAASLQAYEKTFVSKAELKTLMLTDSPWATDKPYVQGDIASVKLDVKGLSEQSKTIIRLEEKVDRILSDTTDMRKTMQDAAKRIQDLEQRASNGK